MALKYFVEAKAIACRRVPMDDMKRIAKATGGSVIVTFADLDGNESFDPACLGSAAEVTEDRICDDEMIMIRGCASSRAVTMLLRGANDYMLDEMDRSIHDALCIVKRALESRTVVPGGGAVESSLSIYLETLATTLGSREQLAIAEFAESLLVIPKILSVNAAKDATELVAKLRAYHHTAQVKPDKKHLARAPRHRACVPRVVVVGPTQQTHQERPPLSLKHQGRAPPLPEPDGHPTPRTSGRPCSASCAICARRRGAPAGAGTGEAGRRARPPSSSGTKGIE